MTRLRRFIAYLFDLQEPEPEAPRPVVLVGTYHHVTVDCSLKGETHQKLMAELGMKPESEAA